MIGEHEIGLMKSDAVFLNFSRDTLVDVPAMAAALRDGRISRYITDFATPEIMNVPGAIVLPHLGASTEEAEENCAMMAAQEISDYIDNGNITNSVNYPACDMGPRPETGMRFAVLHANIPGMINAMTDAIHNAGINLANITSKARGDVAYTLIDLDTALDDAAIARIGAAEGVLRVRTF